MAKICKKCNALIVNDLNLEMNGLIPYWLDHNDCDFIYSTSSFLYQKLNEYDFYEPKLRLEYIKNIYKQYKKLIEYNFFCKVDFPFEYEMGCVHKFLELFKNTKLTDDFIKLEKMFSKIVFTNSYDCPLCGNSTFESKNFYKLSVNDLLDFGEQYLTNNKSTKKYEIIQKLKDDSKNTNVQVQKNDNINLLDYLNSLINCYSSIDFLEETLSLLCDKEAEASWYINCKKMRKIRCLEEQINKINGTNKFYESYYLDVSEPEKPIPPIEPAIIGIKKPGLFNKKKTIDNNIMILDNYNQEYDNYKKELSKYNEELEKYQIEYDIYCQKKKAFIDNNNNKIEELKDDKYNVQDFLTNKNELELYNFLINEIDTTKDKILELYNMKNNLEKLEIIYPKYYDIVALTTMYEYLITKRCDKLEGHDGAYNLYEQELRSNIVINKLDVISNSLESIKQNQYKTYETLLSISNDVNIVKNRLNQLNDTSRIIAYNTAKTAYYTKINNYLTAACAYFTYKNKK